MQRITNTTSVTSPQRRSSRKTCLIAFGVHDSKKKKRSGKPFHQTQDYTLESKRKSFDSSHILLSLHQYKYSEH